MLALILAMLPFGNHHLLILGLVINRINTTIGIHYEVFIS